MVMQQTNCKVAIATCKCSRTRANNKELAAAGGKRGARCGCEQGATCRQPGLTNEGLGKCKASEAALLVKVESDRESMKGNSELGMAGDDTRERQGAARRWRGDAELEENRGVVAQVGTVGLLGRHGRAPSNLPRVKKPIRGGDVHAIDEGKHAGRGIEVGGARQGKLGEGLQHLSQGPLGSQKTLRGGRVT